MQRNYWLRTGALACALVVCAESSSRAGTAAPANPGALRYDSLLTQAQAFDSTLDYATLRFAFTHTSAYTPYGGERHEQVIRMWKLYNDHRNQEALALAQSILGAEYVCLDAQLICGQASAEVGDSVASREHLLVFNKLLESILSSGDGKSKKSAYKVISVGEQMPVLGALNLSKHGHDQELDNGHSKNVTPDSKCYDKVDGVDDKTGKHKTIWFDITVPYVYNYLHFLKEMRGE